MSRTIEYRISLGNIRTWQPPKARFDYVLIRPEYAPPDRLGDLVKHVINQVLAYDGRLVVFVGTEEVDVRAVETSLVKRGFTVDGRVEVPHQKDSRVVRRLFWIDGQ